MAPRSMSSGQAYEDTVRRIQSHERTIQEIQDVSPESERKKRMDSTDISNVGAGFEDTATEQPYLPQIDAEDLRTMSPTSEAGPHSLLQSDSYFLSLPQGTAPTIPQNDRTTRHTNYLAYLLPSDISQMQKHKYRLSRRAQSQHTRSSAHDSDSSEYLSARDRPLSRREDDTDDDDGDADERRSASQLSRYYTPSHNTPSHISEGTMDDVSVDEGQAPESPYPWSPYNPRNDHEG